MLETEKRELQATAESTSAGFQMLEAKVHTAITSENDVQIFHTISYTTREQIE